MLDSFELEGILRFYDITAEVAIIKHEELEKADRDLSPVIWCGFRNFRSSDNCVALSERFSASLQKQLSIGERKNFEKRKPVTGTDPVSALSTTPQ